MNFYFSYRLSLRTDTGQTNVINIIYCLYIYIRCAVECLGAKLLNIARRRDGAVKQSAAIVNVDNESTDDTLKRVITAQRSERSHLL